MRSEGSRAGAPARGGHEVVSSAAGGSVATGPAPVQVDEPRRPLWRRWLLLALVVVVMGAAADLLGWDIRGWF